MATIDVSLGELTGATIIITAIISTTDRLAAADHGEYRQAAGATSMDVAQGGFDARFWG
jgi:hypothetical protein